MPQHINEIRDGLIHGTLLYCIGGKLIKRAKVLIADFPAKEAMTVPFTIWFLCRHKYYPISRAFL